MLMVYDRTCSRWSSSSSFSVAWASSGSAGGRPRGVSPSVPQNGHRRASYGQGQIIEYPGRHVCRAGKPGGGGWTSPPGLSLGPPRCVLTHPPPTPRSRLRGTHFWGVNFGIKKTWCYLSPIPPPGGRTHPPTPLSRVTKLQKKKTLPPTRHGSSRRKTPSAPEAENLY